MAPDLAVLIVSWNTRDLTLNALDSLCRDLAQHGPQQTRVYVVDNASTDGTAEAIRARFPDVEVVVSAENLGFAGGNNLGMQTMGFGVGQPPDSLPRAVFLLNPDTLVQDRAVRTLYEALFAAPGIGLVGAQLAYEDGAFQHGAFHFPGFWQTWIELFPMPGRFYESALNGRYPRALYEGAESFPVDHVLGATMMLCREVIEQVGMFDPQFFMYCEEVDWAMRIRKAGWDVRCVPAAQITHLEGRSTVQVRPQSVVNLWRSRLQLYRKHYAPWRVRLIRTAIRAGMRRKIRQAGEEFNAGHLTAEQRDALITAYQQVRAL